VQLTAEQQEQLWIGLPLILRTIGEEDAAEMIDRAQALVAQDPGLLAGIVAGSARLELIDRLRAERTVEGHDFYATREWREIDQLTAFLAATCIPIVERDRAPAPSLRSLEGELPAAPSRDDVPFQEFVGALPEWARDWLGRHYIVLPTNQAPERAVEAWLAMATDARTRLVAGHLAAVASVYPARVHYVPFDEHDRMHLSSDMRDAPFEFAWVHPAGYAALVEEVGVGITTGLPESEAIRFILVTAFRGWLGAADDESLVDRYWARRHLRTWALRALREVENNLHHIHAWTGRALYDRPDKADYMPISSLAELALTTFIADREALSRVSGISIELFDSYLAHVQNINQRIFALNQRVEEPDYELKNKAAEEEAFFSGILKEPATRAVVGELQQIRYELTRAVAAAL
jgi:hypothetical protein